MLLRALINLNKQTNFTHLFYFTCAHILYTFFRSAEDVCQRQAERLVLEVLHRVHILALALVDIGAAAASLGARLRQRPGAQAWL